MKTLFRHSTKRPAEAPAEENEKPVAKVRERPVVELTSRQEKMKDVSMLAFNIHASVAFSVSAMLMALNLLVMLSTKNRTPWSLYVMFAWAGLIGIHFGVTYSLFLAFHIPTYDLEDFVIAVENGIEKYLRPIIEKIQDGGNPFPRKSKAAKIYDYLLRPV